jgi:hypothetical protein
MLPLAAQEHVMTIPHPDAAPDAKVRADLDRLGITVVPRAVYEWGGYRYSNAGDAIAAAQRAAR